MLVGYLILRRKEWGIHVFPEQRVQVKPTRFRWSQVQERIDDYLAFGVRHVWVIDPGSRKAYEFTSEGMHEVKELRAEEPAISIPLPALFE